MTTSLVQSITDEQIAEIEALYRETGADGFRMMAISCRTVESIISRLRAAERDAARLEWLESAWGGYTGRDGGFHLSVYMPSDAETLREMIDAAMKGDQQ